MRKRNMAYRALAPLLEADDICFCPDNPMGGISHYEHWCFRPAAHKNPSDRIAKRTFVVYDSGPLLAYGLCAPSAPKKDDTRVSDRPPNLDTPILPFISILLFIAVLLFCSSKFSPAHKLLSHG
jgi:hypothetical protein